MDFSSLFSWFFGDAAAVAWAMIGGVIVAAGLIIEKFSEWLDERFFGEYKAHKKLEHLGWLILMLGIFIEIADAGWTAHGVRKAETKVASLEIKTMPPVLRFKREDFEKLLIGKPKTVVEILYPAEDGDSYSLAFEIVRGLIDCGWITQMPRPFSVNDVPEPFTNSPSAYLWSKSGMPLVWSAMAENGAISIVINNLDKTNFAATSLHIALMESHACIGVTGARDERLPDNFVRIVIPQSNLGRNWENVRPSK